MSTTHEVRPGEHLGMIAKRYGVGVRAILDDPANETLAGRPNSGVLEPGEVVTVPQKRVKTVDASMDTKHRFVVRRERPPVRVRLLVAGEEKLVVERVEASYDDVEREEVEVEDDGTIELPIGSSTGTVVLDVTLPAQGDAPPKTIRWHLSVAGLRRPEGEPGALERLTNLGYLRPVSSSLEEVERRAAVEEFQHDHGLTPTGDLDDATMTKLRDVHGC